MSDDLNKIRLSVVNGAWTGGTVWLDDKPLDSVTGINISLQTGGVAKVELTMEYVQVDALIEEVHRYEGTEPPKP